MMSVTEMKPSKQDIQLGALYRVAASKRLAKAVVASLLVSRVGMKPATAEQLAGHWFNTEPLRAA